MTPPTLDVRVLPDLPNASTLVTAPADGASQMAALVDGATALHPTNGQSARSPRHRPQTDLRLLPGGATPKTANSDHRRMLARAHRFVQAVVEIVSGDRPCTQLVRWTDREVYEALTRRVSALSGIHGSVPAADRPRARVVSVKVCRPCDGVAEVAAHIRQGRRSQALAARLEHTDERWICTALQLG